MSVKTHGGANKCNARFHTPYEDGKRKILKIVEQIYLKYSCKVETLVTFKARPPVTGSSHSSANAGNMSKILDGIGVKGRQRFLLNLLNVSKPSPISLKTNWCVVFHSP